MHSSKISIRFFNQREVRAVWDEVNSDWKFSVLDIVSALNEELNYTKNRNYWKYLKAKLKQEGNQLVSHTTQLKLLAADGKKYNTDVLGSQGVLELAKIFPNNRASKFLDWFLYSEDSLDGQSKKKAYTLYEGNILDNIEVGTAKGLQQIHAFLFGGLYDFAGQIRQKNISKDGFQFANARFIEDTLERIQEMPEATFEEIVDKYVEMNVAHPFMEGNGRSSRIGLDLILKKNIQKCVDWSKIGKTAYMEAMRASTNDSTFLKDLLLTALTSEINNRELYMKGIDYSYYYEEND